MLSPIRNSDDGWFQIPVSDLVGESVLDNVEFNSVK